MDYTITFDQSFVLKIESIDNGIKYETIFYADKPNDDIKKTAMSVVVGMSKNRPVTLHTFQDTNNINDITTIFSIENLLEVQGNLLKLNAKLKEKMNTISDDVQKSLKKDLETDYIETLILDKYQNLAKFIHTLKRTILIAYMLLSLKETTSPTDHTDLQSLLKEEDYLKKFLTDSVKLVLNTHDALLSNP